MNFQKIYEFDLANGTGIRVSLFVSGCKIRCPGCFNKEAWSFCSGKKFTHKHIMAIKKLLKDNRCDGLSILGGEPFDQDKKGLKQMIRLCKYTQKINKNVWIWTGHYLKNLNDKYQKKLIKYCNVIVEGPFVKEKQTDKLPFVGSENQRILYK